MFVLQCICPDFWPLFCMRLVGASFRRYVLRKSQVSFIVILLFVETYSGMKCASEDHGDTYLNINIKYKKIKNRHLHNNTCTYLRCGTFHMFSNTKLIPVVELVEN